MKQYLFAIALLLSVSNILGQESWSNKTGEKYSQFQKNYPQEKIYIQTDKPYYSAGDSIWMRVYVVDESTNIPATPSKYVYVELHAPDGTLVERDMLMSDSAWVFCNNINIPKKAVEGDYEITAYTQWMTNFGEDRFFSKRLRVVNRLIDESVSKPEKVKKVVPVDKNNFDVQFMPEGGNLLSGIMQHIAFKAIDSDGLGIDVTVSVVDVDGNTILNATSEHRGMGYFTMAPQPQSKYTIEATIANGTKKVFEFPKVMDSGATFMASIVRGNLMAQILATPDIDISKYSFVVTSKGAIYNAAELSEQKTLLILPVSSLPEGVVRVALVNVDNNNVVAERLIYARREGAKLASIKSNKTAYNSRERAKLSIDVRDEKGRSLDGTYSLAVTDGTTVIPDSTSFDIESNLLLTSDLKGYVESPNYYFENISTVVDYHLDLLMMTQGWRHYSIQSILNDEFPKLTVGHQESQSISGYVKGFFGQSPSSYSLVLMSPKSRLFDVLKVDGSNKFSLTGLNFPDSTTFVIQAISKRDNNKSLTININPYTFPIYQPQKVIKKSAFDEYVLSTFANQSKERIFYANGMMNAEFSAITVTATKQAPIYNDFGVMPTHSVTQERIDLFGGSNIFNILMTLPGVRVQGTDITVRNSHLPPLVFIDNMPVDVDFLVSVSPFDLQQIDLITGVEASIFGPGAAGGVILLTSKDPSKINYSKMTSPSIVTISPLGYKPEIEFYQPRYDVVENKNSKTPDMRTTLLWAPRVVIKDGVSTVVNFYTSDKTECYNVILEGVSNSGRIVKGRLTIK